MKKPTNKITRRDALRTAAALAGSVALGCGGQPGVDGGSPRDGGPDRDAATPDGGAADSGAPDSGTPAPFQLADGHFVPAKLPMQIVTPRPADEIGPASTYLWAHEGVRYEVPVGVVGGAWPFLYELVDAPAGMTIGAQLVSDGDALVRPDDYGVVRWTPPAGSNGSSFAYRVRVTDQEGATAEVSVDVAVDDARFVFVAPDDGTASGDGAMATPLRGFPALFRGLASDATYAGRLVYFRGGAYELIGGTDSNGNARLGGGEKPKVWRAFPDETPIFDCRTAKILFNGGAMDDVCMAGLTFENGRQDVGNAHYIWATGAFDRGLFWRNHFNGLERGMNGNDNPAAIFLSAAGRHRQHIVLLSNVFEAMGPGGGNGVAGYDSYGLDNSLFEDNVALRCRSSYCLWLKGGHRFTTVRGERLVDDNEVGTVLLNISLGRDGRTERSESVEVSYCRAYSPSGHSMRYAWATTGDATGPLFIYRCTVRGELRALNSDTVDVTLERCVLTTTEPPMGATTTLTEIATVTDADLDAQLGLVGAARADYLGTHGAEIA